VVTKDAFIEDCMKAFEAPASEAHNSNDAKVTLDPALFPDMAFRKYASSFGKNEDGVLSKDEIAAC